MAELFTLTAQEVADEVERTDPTRKVSGKTVCRYADSGWLKHVRTEKGIRLFTKRAAARVLPGISTPAADAPPRWAATFAVDRTLWRHSLLLIGEVVAAEPLEAERTDWRAGIGMRWQATPTLVLDLGGFRRLSREGADLGLTLGLSHSFALAAMMPGGAR